VDVNSRSPATLARLPQLAIRILQADSDRGKRPYLIRSGNSPKCRVMWLKTARPPSAPTRRFSGWDPGSIRRSMLRRRCVGSLVFERLRPNRTRRFGCGDQGVTTCILTLKNPAFLIALGMLSSVPVPLAPA